MQPCLTHSLFNLLMNMELYYSKNHFGLLLIAVQSYVDSILPPVATKRKANFLFLPSNALNIRTQQLSLLKVTSCMAPYQFWGSSTYSLAYRLSRQMTSMPVSHCVSYNTMLHIQIEKGAATYFVCLHVQVQMFVHVQTRVKVRCLYTIFVVVVCFWFSETV